MDCTGFLGESVIFLLLEHDFLNFISKVSRTLSVRMCARSYAPNSAFKRSDPGEPHFCVCVCAAERPPPSGLQLCELQASCGARPPACTAAAPAITHVTDRGVRTAKKFFPFLDRSLRGSVSLESIRNRAEFGLHAGKPWYRARGGNKNTLATQFYPKSWFRHPCGFGRIR